MARRVYFNGKFYSAGVNGVHRVADRLIREVDAIVAGREDLRATLELCLLAPAARLRTPALTATRLIEHPHGHTQGWEQFIAPWVARDGLLVNLCNLSPIAHRRKITLIHDAQFFLYPASYPLHFQVGYRLLTPLMARTSLAVLTVSDFSREMLDIFGVCDRDRARVSHNGADHILEAPPSPSIVPSLGLGARPFVIMIGSPAPYKNVQVVFQAFEGPGLTDLDLVVVGASRAQLEAQGIVAPARAVFAGAVDDGGLRSLYQAALCLAYPSRTEGFGLPPLEAMLCGAPAVVAPAGAIPEVCKDAVLYAGLSDPQSWSRAFRLLADEPELRARKCAQGEALARPFTWRNSGERLLQVILQHLG